MEWEITVIPTVLDQKLEWTWVAARMDGETVRYAMVRYMSPEDALVEARATADRYEMDQSAIRDQTFTEMYLPEGVAATDREGK